MGNYPLKEQKVGHQGDENLFGTEYNSFLFFTRWQSQTHRAAERVQKEVEAG